MNLPLEYRWLIAHDFRGFTPWYVIDPEDSQDLRKEYQLETGKDMIPFARRQDRDDIAGFEILDSKVQSKVLTVHLTWKGNLEIDGLPSTKEAKDVIEWIKETVFPATREWITEGELEDLLNENK